MSIQIREVENKEVWEDFLSQFEEKSFLQSWNWGEFQAKIGAKSGGKIWRLGLCEENKLLGAALVIKIAAKRGNFLSVPHLLNFQVSGSKFQIFVDHLKGLAKNENCSFVRIAPLWPKAEENEAFFKNLGFRRAPIHLHPELTWELDIAPAQEQLMEQMRRTTRYLIRQAQKTDGIEITKSNNIQDVEKFNELYKETVHRHHFVPFSLDYLKDEFLAFSGNNQILVFLGKYKNEVISAALVIFWQGGAYYHHGASSLKHSKIPISYLLQWEAIMEAKNRGCKTYNFWGIAPEDKKNHPWAGLTLFKKGFGGEKKEYIKTQDIPLSLKYWLTYAFETIRRSKRRL